MKNYCFRKTFIAAAIAVFVAISSTVPVYASGTAAAAVLMESIVSDLIQKCITPDGGVSEAEGEQQLAYLRSVWLRSCDNLKEVDYNTLSYVYAQLLLNGVPCEVRLSRGAGQGYYIRGTGDMPFNNGRSSFPIKDCYFSDGNGAIFYAKLPDNGKIPGSSSVPSTSAPHISENNSSPGSGSSGGYIPSHFGKNTEKEILQQIAQYTHEIWFWADLINDNLKDVRRYTHMVYANIGRFVDGMNNITTGIYKQIDLLSGYLPRLDDIYNRLFNIQSASWASVDVENRIYSAVAGIDSRLSTVINNGTVQVNTTALEARLDKLISMYAKVNSVVLDTAAINGGQIKDAVGGELKDVMFWGDTAKVDNAFVSSDGVAYSLNDEKTTVNGLTLRSVNLGSTIPAYIANDPVLYAGVWRKGTDYIISDTYNASTGEYVQRVGRAAFDGLPLAWGLDATSFPDNPYFLATIDVSLIPGCPQGSFLSEIFVFSPLFIGGTWGDVVYGDNYIALGGNESFSCLGVSASATLSTVEQLQSVLAGTEFYFIRYGAVLSKSVTSSTIAIPEGDSTISAEHLRITGKYETYDSYTQTSDIINAINNLQLSGGVAADLSAVTTRLDSILAELHSTSGSASCEHTYEQHMEQDADCTLPGLMISTCSKCGDSYSEIVDPLGHDWVISSHVDAVIDPETGKETASAYDVYTCSRCGRIYEDHTGEGAPDEDYSNSTISQLVVKVFSKLGTFAGKLIGFIVHLFDKAISSVDEVISKFNDYTAQISGFGGDYPTWLTGFWVVLPVELQTALTFALVCMVLGVVGKKLFFS